MKRLITIALALACLLSNPGCLAQKEYVSVTQLKEQLPARWTQTYETKWRTVEIDVQPTVPEVDEVPILKITPDFDHPDPSLFGEGWELDWRQSSFCATLNGGGERGVVEAQKKQGGTTTTDHYPPFDMNRAYAENNALTLGEALDYAKNILAGVFEDPETWDFERVYDRMMCNKTVKKKTGEFLFAGTYLSIPLKQKMRGIPILAHSSQGVEIEDARLLNNIGPIYEPRFFFNIRSAEELYISWDKAKIIEAIVADIPLCDFSIVQASLEEEIHAGHIRKIFDIDFGYALYNDPGANRTGGDKESEPQQFYTVPAWRVNCYYLESGKKEMRDYSKWDVPERSEIEYKTVLVNAQTGKVMDRADHSKGCTDYRGFISWEEIDGKE